MTSKGLCIGKKLNATNLSVIRGTVQEQFPLSPFRPLRLSLPPLHLPLALSISISPSFLFPSLFLRLTLCEFCNIDLQANSYRPFKRLILGQPSPFLPSQISGIKRIDILSREHYSRGCFISHLFPHLLLRLTIYKRTLALSCLPS